MPDKMRQPKEEALASHRDVVDMGERLRQRLLGFSDGSWDGVQKDRCIPGVVTVVTLAQQP